MPEGTEPEEKNYKSPNYREITPYNAIGVGSIQDHAISKDTKHGSETEEILTDPVIMEALKCADRQYREGKAIPLEDLMRELGFERMTYNVLISPAVKDYIGSQNRDRARVITRRLKELREDPLGNSKKLEPPLDRLRSMRIGDDRALFSIRSGEVYVELMDKRKSVYDKAKRIERGK